MADAIELSEEFTTFREELLREAEYLGEPQHAVFFEMYAALAAENGDTADLTYVPIFKDDGRPYQVDGYAWDPDRGELHLAVCDFHPEAELASMNADRVARMFGRVRRFCELAINRDFVFSLEETSAAFDLATLIHEARDQIRRIRCVMFSNARLATRKKTLEAENVIGAEMSHNIIDFTRYVDIRDAQGGTEPIELDVRELNRGHLLPCLSAHDGDENVESYLIVMPGILLARMYGLYGARLMEQNVRTFLQARTKTNQGIIKTAREEPEMFFAYNNGITATASGIEIEPMSNGAPGIASIEHLQIVNGGQTTASLLYAHDRGAADLSRIFVQMKLSVIDPERVEEVVPRISRFANTQNKVSEADFFSNHPFHVEMQKISRRLAAPAKAGSLATTKWFYERARGQYRNETSGKSAADKNRFQAEFPRGQVVQKTDLAKFQLSFRPAPDLVSLGAQKSFLSFASEIDKTWTQSRASFNDAYFRETIAKAIIFRDLDKQIGRSDWYKADRGYKANIVTYTIGWMVHHLQKLNRKIDFELVWKQQAIPDELHNAFDLLAPQIAALLKSPPDGISNVSEYAKKPMCWSRISQTDLPCDRSVLTATISLDEANERDKERKAEGELDLELMFEQLVAENMARIIELEPFLTRKRLLSPGSSGALRKLKRGNLNFTRSEKNALRHLFKRLDDEHGVGPESWLLKKAG